MGFNVQKRNYKVPEGFELRCSTHLVVCIYIVFDLSIVLMTIH